MDKLTSCQRNYRHLADKQTGIIVVIVAIATTALLGAGALAFDVGHVILSKTRLQNTIDAAALGGAKEIDISGDTALATAAARRAFLHNAQASGNHDLLDYYNGGGAIEIQFSTTLHPFAAGTTPPEYVRARVSNLPLDTWIAGVIGVTGKSVAATAVAGPSPALGPGSDTCDLAPMMVCGDPAPTAGTHFGYVLHDVQVLKTSSLNGEFEIGPGNFQLVRLEDGQGGKDIREATAGSYGSCMSAANDIETEPGNTVGPVAQGINTRLGLYQGPMHGTENIYPPDVITSENTVEIQFDESGHVTTQTDELDFNHAMYASQAAQGPYDHTPVPDGPGHFQRRILAVPIGDCSMAANGHGFVPLLGYGCFFLLQHVVQQGNESHVYGQFIENCRASGVPGPEPGGGNGSGGNGPHIIQLYEDPNSIDS